MQPTAADINYLLCDHNSLAGDNIPEIGSAIPAIIRPNNVNIFLALNDWTSNDKGKLCNPNGLLWYDEDCLQCNEYCHLCHTAACHLPSGSGIDSSGIPGSRPGGTTIVVGSRLAAGIIAAESTSIVCLGNQGLLAADLGVTHLLAVAALDTGICNLVSRE